MSVIVIIVEDNNDEEECAEDESPGEEWMYDNDVNTGIY